jgi:5'-nucleotidase
LVTNDDGVHAPGIFALKLGLEAAGHDVTVCAPERPRSASGHGITMHKPLRLHEVTLKDNSPAFAVSGTPADSAILGIYEVMQGKLDLVVSGINYGANLGWDVLYSGTVAAAQEATIQKVPSIAISVASYDKKIHWETAANFAARLAPKVIAHGLPPYTLLNVNVPNLVEAEIKGVRITRQGDRLYEEPVTQRTDPFGKSYFWLGGTLAEIETEDGTDTHAVAMGYIAVTPIDLDRTAHALLADLPHWGI